MLTLFSEYVQVQPTEKKVEPIYVKPERLKLSLLFLQCVISALFLYFGVRFYHLLTQVEETCALDRIIPFSYFKLDGSTEMKAVIRKDMMVLCSGEVGMKVAPKKFQANGTFVKMPHTTHDIVACTFTNTQVNMQCVRVQSYHKFGAASWLTQIATVLS